jgi:hypothetical protein
VYFRESYPDALTKFFFEACGIETKII